MNIKFHKNQQSIYRKLIVSFLLIAMFLTVILSTFLYFNFQNTALNMLYVSNIKLLSSVSYSSNYMRDLGINFCMSEFFKNDVVGLIYSKDSDMFEIGNTLRRFERTILSTSYIHSLYIYNNFQDIYISTPGNNITTGKTFFDNDIISIINDIKNSKSSFYLVPIPRRIPKATGNVGSSSYDNVYSFILYDSRNNPKGMNGALVLNIKEDWLRNTMSSINTTVKSMENDILIIDNTGMVVSHSSPENFLKNISYEPYIKRVLASTSTSGFFIDTINNKKFVVSYVTSSILNWKFISLTPYSSISASLDNVKIITITFCFIILCLCLLISAIVSKRIYSPIDLLVRYVKQKQYNDDYASKNEIHFLSNAFTQTLNKTSDLETHKRNSIGLLKNEFLKNLLTSAAIGSPQDIAIKFSEFDIHFNEDDKFILCMLKIDNYKRFVEDLDDKDRILYKFAAANIAHEIVGRHFTNELVDMGDDKLCIIISLQDDLVLNKDSIRSELVSSIKIIQDYMFDLFAVSFSAAIGYICDGLEKISSSYFEVLNIGSYRIVFGHKSIISPENLIMVNNDKFVFPTSKEKLLIDAIKLGDIEQTKKIYGEIMIDIIEYSYDNIISAIMYMTFSIYTCISSIEKSSPNKFFTIDFNMFIRNISQLETIGQINEMFTQLFENIIEITDESKYKKSDKIVNNILSIIQINFYDKNLCLNSIASSMKMSSVYLGRLFKDSTSKSVADYITELRLNKVKTLLDTTNLSTQEILDKAGFERTNYFYTTFKKHFGVSLGEYKLSINSKSSED